MRAAEREPATSIGHALCILFPRPLGDVSNPQSLNRYTYVLNNPTSLTDPTGMDTSCSWQDASNCDEEQLSEVANMPWWDYNWEFFQTTCENGEGCTTAYDAAAAAKFDSMIAQGSPSDSGGGGGSVSSKPQSQVPTWLLQAEVVLQDAASNFVSEFRKGGCVSDFFDRAAGTPGPSPVGPQPGDLARVGGAGWATAYAMERGLTYPLRSSAYRGILSGTESVASYLTVVPLDFVAGASFYGEMKDLSSGACH